LWVVRKLYTFIIYIIKRDKQKTMYNSLYFRLKT